jgi:short-subunit dehydrogenase
VTTAVVTGATAGIGREFANALAARRNDLVLVARDVARLDALATELRQRYGVNATSLGADLVDPAGLEAVEARLRDPDAPVDVLVNNAGIGKFANVADTSLEDWRQIIETNLSGVFYCCRAAIPAMKARGAGFIINISSLAGKNPFVGGAAYCASKAGLNAFSEALMQEVRHDNIRVSYVLPGSVATGFGGHELSGADPSTGLGAGWKLTSEDVARVVVDLVAHDARSLPSRVELRPSRPPKK